MVCKYHFEKFRKHYIRLYIDDKQGGMLLSESNTLRITKVVECFHVKYIRNDKGSRMLLLESNLSKIMKETVCISWSQVRYTEINLYQIYWECWVWRKDIYSGKYPKARCGQPVVTYHLIPVSGLVCWLLNDPATCWCISGTDLLRQFYVLPHW